MSVFPTRILLATDGSESAAAAAQTAVELSNKTSSELHVVHVDTDIPIPLSHMEVNPESISQAAWDQLEEQVRRIEAGGGTVEQTHMKAGNEAEEIITLGESLRVGLVVIGSRGHSIWKRAVMGNVSEDVVRHAHCPVMVVRDEEPRA